MAKFYAARMIADFDAMRESAAEGRSNVYNGGITAEQANTNLWNQFKENTLPKLKDIEYQLKTRTGDFVNEATASANKAVDMADNQSALSREALGISLTPEQQAYNSRMSQLGLATSTVSAQNEAVDVAQDVNKKQAAALTSVQTGLTQEALGDLTGAQTLEDGREANYLAAKGQASAANRQTAGTVVALAAMMM